MKKILLTRTKKSSLKSAKILENNKIPYLIQPLFSVNKFKNLQPINQKLQAVLITSSEALFALKKLSIKLDTFILTVGDKTAQNVKKLGYKNVWGASNSAASLLNLAIEKLKKENGFIVYLSGEKITMNLSKALQDKGYNTSRIVVYKTIPTNEFSSQTIEEVKNNNISEVWIYSKESLEIFCKLVQKHNLLKYFNQIKISCLSSKIADLAKEKHFSKIGIIK